MAVKTRNRLLLRCADIQTGVATGHERSDIPARRFMLYLNENPFIIVYDPKRRQVVRILHQARDLPKLIG